eukprot:Anaeramoba_ignava/a223167_11.p2 GENE.a223167_11~~a223167_11.p2  ORF type:complete len:162 (+),score=11.28 a223167_11:181-666(+)
MSSEKEAFLNKARRFCSSSERCCFDVKQKLRVWKALDIWHDEIIESLIHDGFISEDRFVNAYIHDKYKLNNWGKVKIRYNLQQKQIPSVLINKFLDDLDDEEYRSVAAKLMMKKVKLTNKKEYEILKNSVFRYMLSRGFEINIIQESWQDIKSEIIAKGNA